MALISFLQQGHFIGPALAVDIAAGFALREWNKNDFFLQEGKTCNEYHFLNTGFARAFAHDTAGNEVTTGFFTAGQIVLEPSSFFERTRSQENIQALTGCCSWYISFEQLNALFHGTEAFRTFGRSVLVKFLTQLKSRTLSSITMTAEQRYELLLQQNPELFQHAALKQIASYLGITDTSLSRIRKQFAQK